MFTQKSATLHHDEAWQKSILSSKNYLMTFLPLTIYRPGFSTLKSVPR